MKRFIKIFLIILLLGSLLAEYSCHRRDCKYMKYYKKDVKRGLAH
jgi:hypothetical protein